MLSRKLITVAAALTVLSSAACSSTSDTKNNPPSTSDTKTQATGQAQSKALPECPTPETMQAELGIAYQTPATTATAKERNCSYGSTDGIAAVHFITLASAGDFAPIKIGLSAGGQKQEDISGVGDQAFTSVLTVGSGKDQNTVGARKGTFAVIVTSRASLDKVKSLVTKLLG